MIFHDISLIDTWYATVTRIRSSHYTALILNVFNFAGKKDHWNTNLMPKISIQSSIWMMITWTNTEALTWTEEKKKKMKRWKDGCSKNLFWYKDWKQMIEFLSNLFCVPKQKMTKYIRTKHYLHFSSGSFDFLLSLNVRNEVKFDVVLSVNSTLICKENSDGFGTLSWHISIIFTKYSIYTH